MISCRGPTWPAVRSFLKASSPKLQAASAKLQARPALILTQLKSKIKIERNNMIIDKTPTEGAIRISETIDEHLVTRVYYFMSQQEAVEAFQEEFYASKRS